MRRFTSDRWLAVGGTFTTIGGTAILAYWIYVHQAALPGGFWQLPGYLVVAVTAIGMVLLAVGFFAPGATGLVERKDAKARQRLRRRQSFAKDVLRKLQQLEGKEWSDERFTELEAQVTIERTERSRFALLNLLRPGRTLSYQRSLTKAMRKLKDDMILLQGDPGCGKSVALRHVALRLAADAARSRRADAVIPLYINLKGLRRGQRGIDADLIQDYVYATLREDINADIERFLDDEFERGLTDGTWLFLFDSFDEMPEILGSSRLDAPVRDYSQAIATFLNGMRPCRGVIASREFHSPKGLPWPRWQIKPLTGKRQHELVHRYLLDDELEAVVLAGLEAADSAIVQDASNPLFLSLLAEYVRQSDRFPLSSHDVYEAYVEQRFTTDAERVRERFAMDAGEVRAIAERIAFCLSDENGLGLDPSRGELLDLLERRALAERALAMRCMDALEYLKLVQGQPEGSDPAARVFTFAHRRFQEYFTTAAVLRGVGDVSADALLCDARWRETAVTLCQLQRDSAAEIMARAGELLAAGARTLEPVTEDIRTLMIDGDSAQPAAQVDEPWPASTYEILGIMQAGFANEPERLPDDVRALAGQLLEHAFWRGLTYDRASAVSVAASAPQRVFDIIIRGAFKSGSQLLADEAYRQIARLRELPSDLAGEIRKTLLRMSADGTLRRESLTVRTQLRHFDRPEPLLRAQRLALIAPRLDVVILVAYIAYLSSFGELSVGAEVPILLLAGLMAYFAHVSLYGVAAQLGGLKGRAGIPSGLVTVISAGLRAYLLTFLLLVGFASGSPPVTDMLISAFVSSLALTWAPAALCAARIGQFTSPLAYPFVFCAPLASSLRQLRRVTLDDMLIFAGVVLVMSAVLGGLALLILQLSPATLRTAAYVGAVVCGLLVLWRGARIVPPLWRDALLYIRWSRQAARPELSGLMDWLTQAETISVATRMLVDARVRGSLSTGPQTYAFLADLAHAIRLRAADEEQAFMWRTEGFAHWLRDTPFVRRPAERWQRTRFEDEIARLVGALREHSAAPDGELVESAVSA